MFNESQMDVGQIGCFLQNFPLGHFRFKGFQHILNIVSFK